VAGLAQAIAAIADPMRAAALLHGAVLGIHQLSSSACFAAATWGYVFVIA